MWLAFPAQMKLELSQSVSVYECQSPAESTQTMAHCTHVVSPQLSNTLPDFSKARLPQNYGQIATRLRAAARRPAWRGTEDAARSSTTFAA